jgi:hypothetical protein
MDFEGQRLSERLYMAIIAAFGVLAFLLGVFTESFQTMMGCFGAGVMVAAAACIPDWAFYNTRPLEWLPAKVKQVHIGGRPPPRRPRPSASNLWGLL